MRASHDGGNQSGHVHAARVDVDNPDCYFDADLSVIDGQVVSHILGLLWDESVTAVTVERWGGEQRRYTLNEPHPGRVDS